MPFDTTPFAGEPPFDAQYVGTFQPLFGWVGRTGKRRVQDEVAALFDEVTALVQTPLPVAIDRRDSSLDGISPWTRGTVGRRNWGVQIMGRADGGRSRTAPPEGRPVTTAVSDAWAAIRRRRTGNEGAVAVAAEAAPMSGNGHRSSAVSARTTASLDLVANSSGFNAALDASLEDSGRVLADLIGWMDEFDFNRPDARLILSPIGLLNLYREYYFDFGTRLGPPVEHLWIAPGSDVEITETYTRTDYSFLEIERSFDATTTIEETTTEAETFSEEIERAQQRDISVGVSAQGGVNFPVWQVSASASFDYANSLTESRRQALEVTREVSAKVSKQMRRSSRELTRTSTETQQSSSRRHRLTNPTGTVRNLEMRRKLQHVGIQVQHLGTALCWQQFVRRPGQSLELSELVHIGASEDFMTTPPPDDAPVTLPPKTTEHICPIPFQPWRHDPARFDLVADSNGTYTRRPTPFPDENNPALSYYVATENEVAPESSDDAIRAEFSFRELPTDGYTLEQASVGTFRGTAADHDQPSVWSCQAEVTDPTAGAFRVILDTVNFEKQPVVDVTVTLLWKPPPAPMPGPTANATDHDQAMQRKARKALVDGVRERVKLASQISHRHPDDLRAEERSVIYRHLIDGLIGGSVGSRLHLLSEKIRTIFDVDRMLYYVAPDWWDPKRPGATLDLPTVDTAKGPLVLGDRDRTRFRSDGDGRPSYLITEESSPAPLGRSLGWVAQLDGDDLRNVFLNSPWVKAVLPIRPGYEAAAMAFLRQVHVEGSDGLDAEYVTEAGPSGQTVEQQLLTLAREIRRKNEPGQVYAAGQRVFEAGFQPVEGRVRLGEEPLDVFAEWVEVVPTRQVVPVPYEPPERFRPAAPPAEIPPGAPAAPPIP